MGEKPEGNGSLPEVEAREREWLQKVYRGGKEAEVTFRAILLGALIGSLMCLSNLYVGFKAGWSLGVTITAAIMAFALFKVLRTVLPFLVKRDMGILETTFLLTLASACAFIASAGLSNAVPALLMVSGRTLPTWQLALWIMAILFLGLFMAIPMKRQMINAENLRFPTGYATSEVLKGMYAEGAEAIQKARALFAALGIGLVIAWVRDGVIGIPRFAGGHLVKDLGVWQWKRWLPALPATMVPSSWSVLGVPLARLTLGFEGSLIMAGAGAIMGIRAGASLLLAAVIGYGVLAPIYIRKGDIVHDPPAVTAASGFGERPRVESGADLVLPAAVDSGRSLVFVVREAGQGPAILGFTWKAAASYKSATELVTALNGASLQGAPNPFAGLVQFGFDDARNRLYAELAKKPTGETTLGVDASAGAPALGFESGAAGRVLRFPLLVPGGAVLSFLAAHGTGPGTQLEEERIQVPLPAGVSFADEESLLKALNAEKLPDGTPNPSSGTLAFAMQNGRLVATAARLRQWDSRLTVEDTPGAALLGFAAGQSRSVNYGGFRNIVRWLMWPGVAMMVTAGLLSFFMQWRTVVRAFSGLGAMFKRDKGGAADPLAAVEVPGSWFAIGVVVSGAAAIVLQTVFFGISWWMGILAVVMSFFLAIVACRATGETDITPVGAMGKITQLLYGGLAPGNMVANLMTANVTAGAATSSADLLQALRTGFMVGASPRKQFVGMLIGVVIGSLVSAPVYNILIPSADVIGTDKLPAPAAQTWAGVALLLSTGLKALPESARWGLFWGGLFGIVMTLLERFFPKAKKYMPSPTAMGIAFVIPAFNSVSMFLGAFVAWVIEKRAPAMADRYTMSAASGLIAGESLMGIAVAILIAFQFM